MLMLMNKSWKLKETDPDRMNTVLFLISIIIIKSIMLYPVVPESSEKFSIF